MSMSPTIISPVLPSAVLPRDDITPSMFKKSLIGGPSSFLTMSYPPPVMPIPPVLPVPGGGGGGSSRSRSSSSSSSSSSNSSICSSSDC